MPCEFRLIRHATCLVTLAGQRFLVDPILAEPGALPHVGFTRGRATNPVRPLPEGAGGWDAGVPVLLTHLHFDHFDEAAREQLPAETPIYLSPASAEKLAGGRFTHLVPVERGTRLGEVELTRYDTRHARGPLAEDLGTNSSYLLSSGNDRIVVTGDAIYPDVQELAERLQPTLMIVNAGAATFRLGQRATLDAAEVRRLATDHPGATVVVVHLDALNHCEEGREATRGRLAGLTNMHVPEDGQSL